jgi:hypothetical protein
MACLYRISIVFIGGLAEMKRMLVLLIMIALIVPSVALSDYQRGVLDGLNRGWSMARMYDQALAGSPSEFNQAVTGYNAWIESIFGKNESLMLNQISPQAAVQTSTASNTNPYFISKTYKPVHEIDASWNQTQLGLPTADAYGLINGVPAELYYSWGPALGDI